MQKAFIMGRLVRDAAVKESNGRRFVTFTVATNSKTRGVDKTSYYDVLWSNYYEKMVDYLKKGTAVIVNGDLDAGMETSQKNGQTYLRLNIFADSVEFASLGSGSGNTQNGTTVTEQTAPTAQPTVSTYTAPQPQAPAPVSTYATPQPQAPTAYSEPSPEDGGLPF